MPPYQWGLIKTPYSPMPDIAVMKPAHTQFQFDKRNCPVSGLDIVRQSEVDNFYKVSNGNVHIVSKKYLMIFGI